MAKRIAIFTDIDGTFIDFHSYSWETARPMARQLAAAGVPVIFCSSKTRLEQRALMDDMGLRLPGIVENGSGIYLPPGIELMLDAEQLASKDDGRLRALGVPAPTIRSVVSEIAAQSKLNLYPYGQLTIQELMEKTGLSRDAAERAASRDFSETLTARLDEPTWADLNARFEQRGLRCLHGGRFRTVASAHCSKGAALREVMTALRTRNGHDWISVAVGDSANDRDMLAAADLAFLVQGPDGEWLDLDLPHLRKVPAIGPRGWALVAKEFLP